jgi:hypothetical protein
MAYNKTAVNVRSSALILLILAELLASVVQPLHGGDKPAILAFYQIDQVTDLGTDVRVSLRLRLMNQSDDVLLIDHIALQTFIPGPNGKGQGCSTSTELGAHGSETLTQDFTISRAEYEVWQRGIRPRLALNIQVSGVEQWTLIVPLMKRPI